MDRIAWNGQSITMGVYRGRVQATNCGIYTVHFEKYNTRSHQVAEVAQYHFTNKRSARAAAFAFAQSGSLPAGCNPHPGWIIQNGWTRI